MNRITSPPYNHENLFCGAFLKPAQKLLRVFVFIYSFLSLLLPSMDFYIQMQTISMCTEDPFIDWFRRSCRDVKSCNFFTNRCLQILSLYQEKHTHQCLFSIFEAKNLLKKPDAPKVQEVLTSDISLLKTANTVKCFPKKTLVYSAWPRLLLTIHIGPTGPEVCK